MHNPLRSEAEMFRVVVIVGGAAIPVIALGLLAGPGWGVALLAIEICLAIGLAWRSARGTEHPEAEIASSADAVHRVLVVANQTVGGSELLAEVVRRCEGRDSEVLVVVPALPASRLDQLAHDVDGAIAEARSRLETSLAAMREAGLEVSGEVGDHHDPNAAIEDALREFPADEVIVSTHPRSRSLWLQRGVVERAQRELPLPVTHVIVDLERSADAERAPNVP